MSLSNTNLSRRNFLIGTGAGIALASTFLSFRVNAAPAADELLMVPGVPNKAGNIDRLFLLKGNPLAGPIKGVVTEEGNPAPLPTLEAGERRVLRLMHFNDMHNHMTDIHATRGDTHRLAQMVKKVKNARAQASENEVVLFLSAGDDHTGAVFDELLGWTPEEYVADAGYRTASAAGVDIGVLGNHEFDRGAQMLRIGIEKDADFPLLSANVHGSRHVEMGADYFPAAILESKGLRIGVIGLTTQVDTRVGQPDDPEMAVASPIEAVSNLIPAVSALSDVVVILSHCGYGTGNHQSGKAAIARLIGEGDFDIAAAAGKLTDKPVVLIGGHSHTKLNAEGIDTENVMEGVLMVQAEANGLYLGEIAMSIAAEQGRKAWFTHVGLHPILRRDDRVAADAPEYANLEHDDSYDQEFERAHVQPLIVALEDKLAEIVGEVKADGLLTTEKTHADRYFSEIALANFIVDGLVERSETFPGGRVDFALINATSMTSGLDDGPLSFKQIYDVMPYADIIFTTRVTGAQIRDILDNNAKRILRQEEIVPGFDYSAFLSRGFLHFSKELRYRIEPGKAAAEARAVDITIHGQPIEDVLDREFTMLSNSYIRLGGFGEAWNGQMIGAGVQGGIPGFDMRALAYADTGLVYRNEIIAFVRDAKEVSEKTGAILDGRIIVG